MATFLDENGVLYLWSKIKSLLTTTLGSYLTETQSKGLFATKDVATTSANGLLSSSDKTKLNGISAGAEVNVQSDWSVTDTASDAFIKNKPGVMGAASASSAGTQGFVPAPASGKQSAFLRGDGTWQAISKSTVGLSNVTNDKQMKGLSSGTTENHVIVFGADGYTPKDSGYTIGKSVPSNAVFTDTKPTGMTGATASAAGSAGYVPAPASGDNLKFLCGDGTWKAAMGVPDVVADGTECDITFYSAGASIPFTIPGASTSKAGVMSSAMYSKLNAFQEASKYALKTDITNVYKYKGSKADYASLPTTGNTAGDVWNTEDTGMNYAWTGSAWDAMGSLMDISAITNAKIDEICV